MSNLSIEVKHLWGVDDNTSEDVIRAVHFLSSQPSRTSSSECEKLKHLITTLSTLPPNSDMCSIAYVSYFDVDDNTFCEQYSSNLRPCMIRNCCEKDEWRALERWNSIGALKRWYAHIPIRITEVKDNPGARSEPLRIPLANYLSYCSNDSGGADFPWYGFDDNLRYVPSSLRDSSCTPIVPAFTNCSHCYTSTVKSVRRCSRTL
jgi:hypothetical protein